MTNDKELSKASSHMNKSDRDRKAGMSCAECRRSKLKCDRTFPCSACVRRGCANICPDGTLTATKGNKVLQTQNETLLQTVKRLKSRVRDLEVALSKTQAQISPQPHPLLENADPDVNGYDEEDAAKDEVEEASDLVGSLSIGEQGQARYHGQTSASEFLQTLLPGSEEETQRTLHSQNMHKYGLPRCLIELINAFPFHAITPDPEAKSIILHYLPNHQKAVALALLYFEHAGCSFQAIQRDVFMSELFGSLLLASNGTSIGEKLHAHKVAVVYLVLAIGARLSEDNNDKAEGEKYYLLACAAMSLTPIVRLATTASLQALLLMVQYFNAVDSPACERRWLLSGVMYRLAYSIGLQRDPALWNLDADEIQRRRMLFWEIYSLDAWNSIIYGRPPSLNIAFTDCRFPEDSSEVVNAKGEREMGFESYKHRFAAFILAPVLSHIFGVRQLNYASLLEIDIKLRKLPPPSWLLAPTRGRGEPVDDRAWNSNPTRAMQQYCIVYYREATLLYIHRKYFATAIKINSADPLKTKYGASVMAVSRSACLLLSTLRSLYGVHPCVASKQPFFWSGAFSSIIVLSCLVYNAPGCSLAGDALRAMEDGVELYGMRLFDDNSPSVKLLSGVRSAVRKMFENYKSHQILRRGDEFTVEHEADCTTMHILEGLTVLINVNEGEKEKTPPRSGTASDESSPSSNSEPPEGAFEHDASSHGNWSGPGSVSSGGQDDYRMIDFSGVYYAPDSTIHQTAPYASAASVYGPLDTAVDEHTAVHAGSDSMKSGMVQDGLAIAQNGIMYPYPYPSGYPTAVVQPGGELTMQEGRGIPPYGAPGMQYEPTNGMENIFMLNQHGYVAQGQGQGPAQGLYDQETLERFLTEIGMPISNS